ncbi:MAG: UDP-N-acetylmuramoyl-L-alanine--D-glutamate ligase [Planctomycetes bacterium]|nr:UDP-N-acetylmuramoyl-L-alanine--D-glutamate ligase [Planctomycetota bacterium]
MSVPAAGTRVLVHGLGRFGGGREAVRFLARRGCRVRVADRSAGDDLLAVRAGLDDLGVDWQLGREDVELLDDIELLVVNPAVPDAHPLLTAAQHRGIALTQELDLFLAAYPGRVVGVTGTNGKSSTSTLLHRALRRAGRDALLGGNIGHSLLADEGAWRTDQIAVVEMSSFQLERLAPERKVHGAVFTRVTSDHLDRHGSLAAYQRAKGRLAHAAQEFVVRCAADEVAAAYETAAGHRLRYALTEPAPASVGLDAGFLTVRPPAASAAAAERIVHRGALQLIGDFQVENAMAAAAAAHSLGAPADAIGLALATAPPLPFRLQRVAVLDGVRIFDNAVSTELGSTVSAFDALAGSGRVHWVGGGKSKDGDYQRVARALAPRVASAHLFGAAATPLAASWPSTPATAQTYDDLEAALAGALGAARPGETLLFSPAFASFDQYPNFRARGLAFHEWLASRRAEGRSSG